MAKVDLLKQGGQIKYKRAASPIDQMALNKLEDKNFFIIYILYKSKPGSFIIKGFSKF
jgi:hypothetical protein